MQVEPLRKPSLCGRFQAVKQQQLKLAMPGALNAAGSVAVLLSLSTAPMSAPAQPSELVFLGPRGTYSKQAALAVQSARGLTSSPFALESLTAVADEVSASRAKLGILPIAATVSSFPAAAHAALLRGGPIPDGGLSAR
jgi:hypothetical protein